MPDLVPFIRTLKTSVTRLRKDIGDTSSPGGATVATDAAGVVKMLTTANERLTAMLAKMTTDGAVPEGMAAELKTIAGALLTVANAGTPEQSDGLTNMAAAGAAPVTQNEKRADGSWVIKALAPEVEMAVTMNTAQDFMYGAMSLMREGKLPEAKVKIASIVGMLNSVGGGAAGGEGDAGAMKNDTTDAMTKTVKCEMTQEQFVSWSYTQLEKAAKDPAAIALKRLSHLQKAADIAATFWDGERTSNPLTTSIEMIAYFAPESDGAKKGDVTAAKDQTSTETDATKVPPERNQFDGLNAATGGPSSPNQGTNSVAQNTGAATMGMDVFKRLEEELSTRIALVGHAVEKRKIEAQSDGFVWPLDIAKDDDEEAAKQAKINKAETPHDTEDSWGKDPWAAST